MRRQRFNHFLLDRQTDRQAGRQAGRQADRQTDRQAGRQTDRQGITVIVSELQHMPYNVHTWLASSPWPSQQQQEEQAQAEA